MGFEDGLQAVKTSTVNNVLGAHGKQQTIVVTRKGIDLAYDVGFLAGAQSRQAEIDELQKQLDNAIKTNEMLVAYKNELLDELQCVIKGETK